MTNATSVTLPCPVCKQPVPLGAVVCPNANCKEDLSSLAAFDTVGQQLYKLALRRVKEGKQVESLQLLNAAATYAPQDVDIWVVLGKLEAQAKHFDAAVRAWEHALVIRADEPRALAGIQEVKRLQRRQRLTFWSLPLVGILTVFLCGLAGGRQSHTIFPVRTQTTSPTAEVAIHEEATLIPKNTETLPTPSTETLPTPSLAVTYTETVNTDVPPISTPLLCQITTGFGNGGLYVRAGPGTHYPAIGLENEGEMLSVIETFEGSTWIKVITPAGIEGFVQGRFCK